MSQYFIKTSFLRVLLGFPFFWHLGTKVWYQRRKFNWTFPVPLSVTHSHKHRVDTLRKMAWQTWKLRPKSLRVDKNRFFYKKWIGGNKIWIKKDIYGWWIFPSFYNHIIYKLRQYRAFHWERQSFQFLERAEIRNFPESIKSLMVFVNRIVENPNFLIKKTYIGIITALPI